jgi:hypothetical protein
MVPGGQKTYIGTPHTHDSVYDEQIEGGAAVLKIPLFEHAKRWDDTKTQTATRYRIDFEPGPDGLYVFTRHRQIRAPAHRGPRLPPARQ